VTWQPAYLTGSSHPWGLVPGTNSWINCGPANESPQCLNKTVFFRVRFYVPDGWSDPTLTFDIKADNAGTVFLNGSQVGPRFESNGNFPATSLSTSMRTGLNEMILKVEDWGGLAGFNYRAIVNVTAPEPLVQLPPGVETITITPTAGQSKRAGAADPEFTYTSSNPSVTLTGALGRLAGETEGTYAYNTGTLTAPDGYVVVLAPGQTFTIEPPPLVSVGAFAAPVRADAVNRIKAGATVPLKFRLTQHGAGLPIADLAIEVTTVPATGCTARAGTGETTEVAVGGSGLQDLGDGEYQWNWKVPRTFAGSCRRLLLVPSASGHEFGPDALQATFDIAR
jgi:hypothetical protein